MRLSPLEPRPLAGPPLQFALLIPVLALFTLLAPAPPRNSYARGRPVLLPDLQGPEHHAVAEADISNDIVISVQPDGYVFIGQKWYPAPELLTGITTRLAKSPHSRVLVRFDRSVPFRSVRAILRVLQTAQIQSALLVTYEGYPEERSFPLVLLFKNAT